MVVGQKVARKHDRGFGVGIDGRPNGLDREQDRGRGGCHSRCGIPCSGACSAIERFTPGPVRRQRQQSGPWVLNGPRVGPVAPGQQERKQAEKCIARHADLPPQAASWTAHFPRPRRRCRGCREFQAAGRVRPDVGNQNKNWCRMQESRFGERHRRGRQKHRQRRESLGSTHGCTPPFVRASSCVWSKNPVRRFRTRATGPALWLACVLTLSALLIVQTTRQT